MKRTSVAVVLLVASCRATYTNEFKAIYENRAQLVKERNIDALLAQMTPDYTIRLRNGQAMTLADIRARWTFYYDSVLVRHANCFGASRLRLNTPADTSVMITATGSGSSSV